MIWCFYPYEHIENLGEICLFPIIDFVKCKTHALKMIDELSEKTNSNNDASKS